MHVILLHITLSWKWRR